MIKKTGLYPEVCHFHKLNHSLKILAGSSGITECKVESDKEDFTLLLCLAEKLAAAFPRCYLPPLSQAVIDCSHL